MRVVVCLACVVVFCTTYALILPAITMETGEFEPDGHVHTDECYQLIRTDEKKELACPLELHTHTEDCYDEERNLICGYADFVVHTHNSYCYDAQGELVCTLPEITEHTHTESCYAPPAEEDAGTEHVHTSDCYTTELGGLICGMEENEAHIHDESCYIEREELVCGQEESEEHIHDADCYETVWELNCLLDENAVHYHTEDCYEHNEVLTCGLDGSALEEGFSDSPQDDGGGAEESAGGQEESAGGQEESAGGQEESAGGQEEPAGDQEAPAGGQEALTGSQEALPGGPGELICGKEEIILHTHSEDCYDAEGRLVCGRVQVTEHLHTEECMRIVQEASEEKVLVCPYAVSGSQEDGDAEEGSDEETDGQHTYYYEDETVSAEVTLPEESGVPEDAVLTVRPVTAEDTDYDCELLKAQAEEAMDRKAERIDFYDISFYTQEGDYIPVTSPAAVTLHFHENASMAESEELAVLHYQADGEAPAGAEITEKEADGSGGASLTFQTDGFSVFGFMVMTEGEPVALEDRDSFMLTYSVAEQSYTITFLVRDSGGNPISGSYQDIPAESGKRYVFGETDGSAEGETVIGPIAPAAAGYTYSGASVVTAENPETEVCSVATGEYTDDSGSQVSGIVFYTSEPPSDDQSLLLENGDYTVTLTYTQNEDKLDGKSFAIVNQAGGSYAMTASADTVNNVAALASRSVTVVQNEGVYQVTDDITAWTFHRQDDGTYTVSAIVGEGDQAETKYLRLCETPFDSSNDGRGSLTLTDEANASHITVTETDDGRVTMESGSSNINLDSSEKKFWCYKDKNNEHSQHRLCEIEVITEDYSGDWVIVNKTSDATRGVAMQAGGVNGDENGNRAGLSVEVRQGEEGEPWRAIHNEATVWQFEKQEDGTYYISTSVTSADGLEERKYLTIGAQNAPVTVSETPQAITVSRGAGDYAGMVRLCNPNGMAVNLAGGDANRGFVGYNDSGENEWHTLCKLKKEYGVVTTTVNHPSSVINLFDYWVSAQGDRDDVAADSESNLNNGINQDHTLKFSKNQKLDEFNGWTGDASVYPNIVGSTLGADTYPVLNVGNGESLKYLFDPDFDCNGKASYRKVNGLLQVDSQGYYYYNSAENFAEYHEDTNSFTLYDTWGVYPGGTSPKGQFFPFNHMDEVANVISTDAAINHYLGLTLTTRFVQQYGGHTTSSRKTDTVFNFAGDDDVWIFIDGVLVADLGGIHDRASVSINFATGEVKINGEASGSLKESFTNAGKLDASEWNGDIFADNTYHTLKFFYLERGNTDSNLSLQYNLTEIPLTGIYKVNQYGDAVAGAEFSVYKANYQYNIIDASPAYVGTTDAKGEMIFQDNEGMPYSLKELRDMFGDYFVLKETKAPENYSLVSDEIHLYIKNGLLLCDNTYKSGAWSSATLLVSAPDTLQLVDGRTIDYYDLNENKGSNGTLFAVVLKYDGTGSLTAEGSWSPVYGSDKKGYTVVEPGGDFIGAVIRTAKMQQSSQYGGGSVCFKLSASGAMQAELTNLPGNVDKYYYMLGDTEKGQTQYTVAYYWTQADSLEGANSSNTVRVNAEDNTHKFDRVFGANIEVPNLINRLFVQKLNEEGELVNSADFALYEVEEADNRIYYKAADGTRIYLEPDEDGDNRGTAEVSGETGTFQYEVNASDGCISVGETYTIRPYRTARTLAASASNPAREDGTATFSGISDGKYYLREISVPAGYQLNQSEVMVLVAEDAVYANAGTEDDGVTVARGPGYLVATMSKFASEGDIDNTLTWVYERMRISDESHTFSAYDGEAWKDWKYLTTNHSSVTEGDPLTIYLKYDPYVEGNTSSLFNYAVNNERYGEGEAESVRRRLYTTVGWNYYELYQDSEYGEKHSGEANYTVLQNNDGTPMEIANLFSRSTYVQVTDKKQAGSLEISKIVKNAPQDNSADYEFVVELWDAKGEELTGSYNYEVYNISTKTVEGETIETEVREPAKDDKGENITDSIASGGTIRLKDRQVAVIKNIPAGTRYTVTEQPETNYIISAIRDKGKPAVGSGTGEEEFEQAAVNGTLYWAVTTGEDGAQEIDTTSTVVYTNTYLSDFTILKVDSSNSEIRLSGAEFVFYKVLGDGTKQYYSYSGTEESSGTTSWTSVSGVEIPEAYKLTTSDEGIISLRNIADGAYYLEELTAPKGYYKLEQAIPMTVVGGKLTGNYGTTGVEIMEDRLTLKVPNSTGYELPSTGGHGTLPYMFCGIALMAGTLIYILYRRREE